MATVRITWDDSITPDVQEHKLYRNDVLLATIANGVETYDDITAVEGETYKYEIQSKNPTGESTEENTGVGGNTKSIIVKATLTYSFDGTTLDSDWEKLNPEPQDKFMEQNDALYVTSLNQDNLVPRDNRFQTTRNFASGTFEYYQYLGSTAIHLSAGGIVLFNPTTGAFAGYILGSSGLLRSYSSEDATGDTWAQSGERRVRITWNGTTILFEWLSVDTNWYTHQTLNFAGGNNCKIIVYSGRQQNAGADTNLTMGVDDMIISNFVEV